MEQTFCMLKPDVLQRGIEGKIIEIITNNGFKIKKMEVKNPSEETIDEHYAHVKDRDFYPEMRKYMLSGPVLCMVLEKENAIADLRKIMGATRNPEKGTIREKFALSEAKNSIHGSDSVENAKIEIKRFFN